MIVKPQHRLTDQSRSAPAPASQVEAEAYEQASQGGGLSMLQITSILKSYWKQTIIIGVCVTCVTAVAVKFMPKSYTATATLMVNAENRDPLAGRQLPADMLANYVTTQTELMLGPVVLLPVVDRLKLTQDKDFAAGFSGTGTEALRDYVEKNLFSSLAVDMGRGGQLLYVSASAKDPEQAATIANAVADVYLEEEQRRMNEPAGERAQRYSQELAELRAKATAAQDKVIQFQKQNGITDITNAPNADTEVQALNALETQLLTAQSTRRSLESQTAGQEATTAEVMASPAIQLLKTQLNTEQTDLAQISTVYGPRHPKVLELQSEIDATRRSLAAEIKNLSATTSTQLNRARDLEERLNQAVATQRAKVLNLRQVQDEGGKLVLELNSAEAVYKSALDGYDQILFAAVGNASNVSYISRATPPVKPTKPSKVKLLTMGIIGGFLFGLAAPLIYELLFNRRVRCRDDIERDFGIPVLAQFDAIEPGPAAA